MLLHCNQCGASVKSILENGELSTYKCPKCGIEEPFTSDQLMVLKKQFIQKKWFWTILGVVIALTLSLALGIILGAGFHLHYRDKERKCRGIKNSSDNFSTEK